MKTCVFHCPRDANETREKLRKRIFRNRYSRAVFRFSPSDCHAHLLDVQRDQRRQRTSGALRAELQRLLGWDRLPAKPPPLDATSIWIRSHALGTIERIVFTAEEGAHVPAYVCLPKERPRGFVICLQGHSSGMHNSIGVAADDETKPITVEGGRDFALGCLANGFGALCIEQRSLGERAERNQSRTNKYNPCHDAAMRALMLGRTLLGERVYDVARGIELLTTRFDGDLGTLGVMGNSGGGTVAMYAAALFDRIDFAILSCCFSTFRDSILSIYHCTDNYVPGLYAIADMPDVLGLMAPRPVLVVSGREDPIFPHEGTARAFAALERIYEAAGAGDRCRWLVGEGGHRFYPEEAWPIALELLSRRP